MLRFLLPLLVASTTDDLWRMAYVLAYNASLLPAPLLGLLAKPYQLFRPVFFGGFMSMYVSLRHCQAGFGSRHAGCPSEVCGLGVGAVATMAPLFAVDFAPKADNETRKSDGSIVSAAPVSG